MDRLTVQGKLLSEYEQPVYQKSNEWKKWTDTPWMWDATMDGKQKCVF